MSISATVRPTFMESADDRSVHLLVVLERTSPSGGGDHLLIWV